MPSISKQQVASVTNSPQAETNHVPEQCIKLQQHSAEPIKGSMKIFREAKKSFNLIKYLSYICSSSGGAEMSHCGLGGWIDQFKDCFACMEMQSDRN